MGGEGFLHLEPIQSRILGHVLTINESGHFPYETVIYSAIKKEGKTTIAGSVGAWYAECARPGTEIYVIANSQEQGANRAFKDMTFHFKHRIKERGRRFCKIGEYRIDLQNGTSIQVLSNSFRASAGARQALTLFDELWGAVNEADQRMWDEMVPIATIPLSLRFISTYAGFENESTLLWDLYMRGIGPGEGSEYEKLGQGKKIPELKDLPCWENKSMFTYWDHEPRMPWQTEQEMEKNRETQRPAAFLRLFMNHWVTSHEMFIPSEWWTFASKAYENPATLWDAHPYRKWPITIGIDAGIQRDSTAMVGVAYDAKRGKVGIVFHYIWTPTKENPIDLDITVVNTLRELKSRGFNISNIVYDKTHMLQTMSNLKKEGFPCQIFEQTVPNMTAASQLLYELFKNRNIEAYPNEDMRRHIMSAVAETNNRGYRIVKVNTGRKNQIDAAIALAMAAYDAVNNGGVDISVPIILRSPYRDMSNMRSQKALGIPRELQTDDIEEEGAEVIDWNR